MTHTSPTTLNEAANTPSPHRRTPDTKKALALLGLLVIIVTAFIAATTARNRHDKQAQ